MTDQLTTDLAKSRDHEVRLARLPDDWPHRQLSRFVQAGGVNWHVQQTGLREGACADLLLVHGTGSATHSWRGLLPLLAQNYRVTAMDLPGHGFSSKPPTSRLSLPGMAAALEQLVQSLGIKPRIATGHSAGAAILAHMALERSLTPEWLVALNGAFRPFAGVAGKTFGPLARAMVLNPILPHVTALRARTGSLVARLLERTGSSIDAAGERAYRQVVQRPSHVASAIGMMARWELGPLWQALPNLPCPLLLITGDNDRTVSPEVSRELARRLPSAIHETLPGLGHLAHEEAPERVAALIIRSGHVR